MKYLQTILVIMMLAISTSLVLAQQGEQSGPSDTSKGTPEIMPVSASLPDQGLKEAESKKGVAQTPQELETMIKQKQQEMEAEQAQLKGETANMVKNQNQVRLAVHALLAMENLTGGIGPQVSAIAKGFNNSAQNANKAEEKIQQRSGLARLFAGGDHEAAKAMEQEVNQNQERIQQLKQLKEQCNCSQEVKDMFQEQIQNMETEQNRLAELAQDEKQKKGMFGWIWK